MTSTAIILLSRADSSINGENVSWWINQGSLNIGRFDFQYLFISWEFKDLIFLISKYLRKSQENSRFLKNISRDVSRYLKKYWDKKYGLLHFLRFWRRLDLNLAFLVPITSPLLVCINLPMISTFVNPVLPRIKKVKLVKRSCTICCCFSNNVTAWCQN